MESEYAVGRYQRPMNELPSLRIGGCEHEFLLVEALARSHPHRYDFWDGNWLDTKISVNAGAFTGHYDASLRSDEFARFLSSLRIVYELWAPRYRLTLQSFPRWKNSFPLSSAGTRKAIF